MVAIKHNHEDGTLVYDTRKGDGVYKLIGPRTEARFKYFPTLKKIGIPQSRDQPAKRNQIETARRILEANGYEVTVEIDDTPRDAADVKADRAERLDRRYGRLAAKAEREAAEAVRRRERADELAEKRGGQPRLNGHSSSRSWDATQKRIEQNDQAAATALEKARRAQRAAAAVGTADAYSENPAVIIRRIARREAELRKVMHLINGTRPANDWRGAYGLAPVPASGAELEELKARQGFLEARLDDDRAALAAHEDNGYVRLTRESVHKGDVVAWSSWPGSEAEVIRVNPKTVTLDRSSWPRTLPYEDIRSLRCPHENTVTAVRSTGPSARPRAVPPVPGQPPEREAPLAVDASTEFFATPPAVVKQIIETAGLEPGMTVLEPSAGLGAIAAAAVPVAAAVDCVDVNRQFAGPLKRAGARAVQIADFLDVEPRAEYHRILMNPPFGRQADIAHVTHALGFARPGGLVIAVMPAGVTFRQDKTTTAFRELVTGRSGRFEKLPDDAFAGSGTSVRTVLAVIPVPGPAGTEEAVAS